MSLKLLTVDSTEAKVLHALSESNMSSYLGPSKLDADYCKIKKLAVREITVYRAIQGSIQREIGLGFLWTGFDDQLGNQPIYDWVRFPTG